MKAVDSCELSLFQGTLLNYLIIEVVFQLFLLGFFSYFDSHCMMCMYISLHFVMETRRHTKCVNNKDYCCFSSKCLREIDKSLHFQFPIYLNLLDHYEKLLLLIIIPILYKKNKFG